MSHPPLPSTKVAAILALTGAGLTGKECAQVAGVSQMTVTRIKRRAGLPIQRRIVAVPDDPTKLPRSRVRSGAGGAVDHTHKPPPPPQE
jgi:hypothetical protein